MTIDNRSFYISNDNGDAYFCRKRMEEHIFKGRQNNRPKLLKKSKLSE